MIEQYISFETAKLAKEKGFPQESNRLRTPYYNYKGVFKGDVTDWLKVYLKKEDTSAVESVSAPTQSLLQRWLREENNIHISIFYDHYSKTFEYDVCEKAGESWNNETGKTYEEALEHGLIEALKII